MHGLLDPHCSPDRARCTGEAGQHPVSEALDNDATFGLHRRPQEPIMLPAQHLGLFLPQTHPQGGGTDQIGNQDGGGVAAHRRALPGSTAISIGLAAAEGRSRIQGTHCRPAHQWVQRREMPGWRP